MRTERPVLIMAGGTGGHVFPALAVARALQDRGTRICWLGTRRGLEAKLVPAAGIPFDWLSISGLRGKGRVAWLLAPLRLAIALVQALQVIWRRRPRAVLGMGGFAAGPGGVAAFLTRRPLVIHEQNAVAGLTNRLLAPLAKQVLCGFETSFAPRRVGSIPTDRHACLEARRGGPKPALRHLKARCVGNPVRAEIAALPAPRARLAGRYGPLRLLVIGGSQGAQALNQVVPQALARLSSADQPRVLHQCGAAQVAATQAAYHEAGLQAEVSAFIDDMATAYAWADLVLARAGALTLAELTAAGIGALLVPYPHAVDDHQTHNAQPLVAAGAAHVIPQHALTPECLATKLQRLFAERDSLLTMAIAARGLARIDAAEQVANACLQLAQAQEQPR